MHPHSVIAVVGSCAPERAAYAERLARSTARRLVRECVLTASLDPLGTALRLAASPASAEGSVIELPTEAAMEAIIGTLGDEEESSRLDEIVCVVDALHLREDLRDDEFFWIGDVHGVEYTARALVLARQIEYASSVVLVGADALPTAELSLLMALVSHLAPHARLVLDGHESLMPRSTVAYAAEQDGPGWACLLSGDFVPRITDSRVSAVCYESIAPLHPGRLHALLTTQWESGELGTVIRSAGFCRLATRAGIVGAWEQAGRTVALNPLTRDDDLAPDEDPLALGQHLALIGIDLDEDALRAALDAATLTAEELGAGPEAWSEYPDPFPLWPVRAPRPE